MHVKKNTYSAQSYSTLGFDCFYSKILRNNAIPYINYVESTHLLGKIMLIYKRPLANMFSQLL